jgi:eukaryotic-like serine/threonine-protein kinase
LSVSESPQSFGRYCVRDVLGRGSFGTVYLGFDEELRRKVAIKVPHRECVASERDIEEYIAEARTVARLRHDGIAAVHDVGRTGEGLCYVVSHSTNSLPE